MRRAIGWLAALALTAPAIAAAPKGASSETFQPSPPATPRIFSPRQVKTTGSVRVGSHYIAYDAVAGRMLVFPHGHDDAAESVGGKASLGTAAGPPVASIFYVAYFERGAHQRTRPVTFLYNGGPGSSTIWLHMGAFGPVRIATRNDSHTPAAPYRIVQNAYSLLDASDLVFIDAPGTGFSRIEGRRGKKAFWGVDQDARAFASFIGRFLSQYGRWNSPKYLLGESYGTTRSAVLIDDLETDENIDFNGVILLSQVLNFDLTVDDAEGNPGMDLPYELELPTFAATAWYHHLLSSQPLALEPFLAQVEHFATGDYARALEQGARLPEDARHAVAEKLHEYTGLSVAYIERADLRVSGPQFEHELLSHSNETAGRLDTRFTGPTMDPLGEQAEYDPQTAAIGSAYVSGFNDYVRRTLHYTTDQTYRPEIDIFSAWDFRHRPSDPYLAPYLPVNVMADLASAMKYDPNLKICLNGGYFDLATPFYEGIYEMAHLPMSRKLQANIEYHYYESGHMLYANVAALRKLHENITAFIASTEHP